MDLGERPGQIRFRRVEILLRERTVFKEFRTRLNVRCARTKSLAALRASAWAWPYSGEAIMLTITFP